MHTKKAYITENKLPLPYSIYLQHRHKCSTSHRGTSCPTNHKEVERESSKQGTKTKF